MMILKFVCLWYCNDIYLLHVYISAFTTMGKVNYRKGA